MGAEIKNLVPQIECGSKARDTRMRLIKNATGQTTAGHTCLRGPHGTAQHPSRAPTAPIYGTSPRGRRCPEGPRRARRVVANSIHGLFWGASRLLAYKSFARR